MARRQVGHYALFHDVDGTASLAVYYSAGGADALFGLPVDEADYITSLLREEKPMDYDHERRRFMSGAVEPVGEGEGGPTAPFFRLENWIMARPAIAAAIVWEEPGGLQVPYALWSSSDKAFLQQQYLRILAGIEPGVPEAMPLATVPGPGATIATRLTRNDAWGLYVAHVAQSLAVEACRLVPWSVLDYSGAELQLLFSSRSLFQWSSGAGAYSIDFSRGVATPGDPHRTWRFARDLLRSNRLATMGAAIDWCRANLRHFSGGWDAENVESQWQYRGFPPVERMIAGTPISGGPPDVIAHRTGGCWGTTGFLRAVLRTMNIPVELVTAGGHAVPHFLPENRYLTHGDDPYNALFKTMPWVPGVELLIDAAQFAAWFGPGTVPLDNVGRRVRELAIEHLPYYVLRKHCEDQAAGLSHADSRVYEIFERNYTVAQLEALTLWSRMDARIVELGGCAAVPAG